jgi:hypothetical protein
LGGGVVGIQGVAVGVDELDGVFELWRGLATYPYELSVIDIPQDFLAGSMAGDCGEATMFVELGG